MQMDLCNCVSDNNQMLKSYSVIESVQFDTLHYDNDKIGVTIVNCQCNTDKKVLFDNCNYVKLIIGDVIIYGFVEQIIFHNNYFDITIKKDLLMTYSMDIKNLSAIIERNEKDFNAYLNDGNMLMRSYEQVQIREFPSGFSNDYSIILNCSGVYEEGL